MRRTDVACAELLALSTLQKNDSFPNRERRPPQCVPTHQRTEERAKRRSGHPSPRPTTTRQVPHPLNNPGTSEATFRPTIVQTHALPAGTPFIQPPRNERSDVPILPHPDSALHDQGDPFNQAPAHPVARAQDPGTGRRRGRRRRGEGGEGKPRDGVRRVQRRGLGPQGRAGKPGVFTGDRSERGEMGVRAASSSGERPRRTPRYAAGRESVKSKALAPASRRAVDHRPGTQASRPAAVEQPRPRIVTLETGKLAPAGPPGRDARGRGGRTPVTHGSSRQPWHQPCPTPDELQKSRPLTPPRALSGSGRGNGRGVPRPPRPSR